MILLVGALVALAVVAVAGTGGRPVGGGARDLEVGRPATARTAPDLSAVLLAVSAQLRAGAAPGEAWSRALGMPGAGPAPSVDALLTATGRPARLRFPTLSELRGRTTSRGRRAAFRGCAEDGAVQRARAVLAATRLADELGAPLAGVLDRIAFAVAADEEADGERRAALAGPRSTAQVLAWLPLLGVALGALLGADPVAVVLSGGLGTASAVLGVTMLLLGRWWTAALLTRAGRAGDERTSTTRSGAVLDAAFRTCAAFTGASRAGGASPADPPRARASRAGVPRTDASRPGASRAGASRARATRSTVTTDDAAGERA
ncbi:type II secretion system F family protein [Cellulomonas humilata]|uniref:Tight adherence protein B n=1 Tax=Cellulomonas humilata TaxID=144055 RepID=A0ABU0EIQ8_9CELL|nr:hypothetical protein [Cellulomonas humilata]MDQ0375168.1 tight adherence protein B [Cellulomonas humilata]